MASEKLILEIDAQVGKAISALRKVQKQVGDTGKTAGRMKTGLDNLKQSWFGMAAAIGVATIAMGKAIGEASDLEETTGKFNVVFKDVGDEAEAMAQKLVKSYGMSEIESRKLLSNTGDLLTGFGMTGKMALDLSSRVQTLSADLASFTNIEGGAKRASEALTSAMLGEREAAKALGIVINEDLVKAEVAAMKARSSR